jgi:predicted nucleic acid-binding Zn ribbon protein
VKKCIVCDNPLPTGKYKFCAVDCEKRYHLAKLKKQRLERMPEKNCVICGTRLGIRQRFYCSHGCKATRDARAKRQDWFEGKRHAVKCIVCGDLYTVGSGIGKTCGNPECRKVVIVARSVERESFIEEAKCPGCGIIHRYDFSPGGWIGNGIPRVGCERYPRCVIPEYDHAKIQLTFEMGERATI